MLLPNGKRIKQNVRENSFENPFYREQVHFDPLTPRQCEDVLSRELENFIRKQDALVTIRGTFERSGLVGSSALISKALELAKKVARSDLTVLIRGESGTGKELLAKAIHYNSRRSARPFVAVNCAAIPRELLESELFGHERGAFTGASALRHGKFELAEGGSIFLDEIGDMAIGLQAKILRVLQERQFERVGGERSLSADVRVIAATNQNLEVAVEQKSFREDLYYRLNVVAINLPPLRERTEDIPLLVNHFLHLFAEEQRAKEQRQEPKIVSSEALELILAYRWPGNVRELESAVKRACVLAPTSLILPEHLPDAVTQAKKASAAGNMLSAHGTDREGTLSPDAEVALTWLDKIEEMMTRPNYSIKQIGMVIRPGNPKTAHNRLNGFFGQDSTIEVFEKRKSIARSKWPNVIYYIKHRLRSKKQKYPACVME